MDPAILFFLFGIFAGAIKSNLEIPQPISRFLSLYLLMAIGLKGGFALAQTGLSREVAVTLLLALGLAFAVPLLAYGLLSRLIDRFDAAALAATYGSVSAVTFITAIQHLDNQNIAYGGHMAAAMALMESPAIFVAVLLANRLRHVMRSSTAGDAPVQPTMRLGHVLHEALTDGAQLLLLGALVVGMFAGGDGESAMKPFAVDLFRACWPSSCWTWACWWRATSRACARVRGG